MRGPHTERASFVIGPPKSSEGSEKQRVHGEEGRGGVVRGVEVAAHGQYDVVLTVPVRPDVHAPRRHIQGYPLEASGRHEVGEQRAGDQVEQAARGVDREHEGHTCTLSAPFLVLHHWPWISCEAAEGIIVASVPQYVPVLKGGPYR